MRGVQARDRRGSPARQARGQGVVEEAALRHTRGRAHTTRLQPITVEESSWAGAGEARDERGTPKASQKEEEGQEAQEGACDEGTRAPTKLLVLPTQAGGPSEGSCKPPGPTVQPVPPMPGHCHSSCAWRMPGQPDCRGAVAVRIVLPQSQPQSEHEPCSDVDVQEVQQTHIGDGAELHGERGHLPEVRAGADCTMECKAVCSPSSGACIFVHEHKARDQPVGGGSHLQGDDGKQAEVVSGSAGPV